MPEKLLDRMRRIIRLKHSRYQAVRTVAIASV